MKLTARGLCALAAGIALFVALSLYLRVTILDND